MATRPTCRTVLALAEHKNFIYFLQQVIAIETIHAHHRLQRPQETLLQDSRRKSNGPSGQAAPAQNYGILPSPGPWPTVALQRRNTQNTVLFTCYGNLWRFLPRRWLHSLDPTPLTSSLRIKRNCFQIYGIRNQIYFSDVLRYVKLRSRNYVINYCNSWRHASVHIYIYMCITVIYRLLL